MNALASAYHAACERYPGEELMLVLDIDGTIVDMQYLVKSVLQSYDQEHATTFFTRLALSDVDVHEDHVEQLLERLNVPAADREAVMDWYLDQRWREEVILSAHRAFPGVLPVIRWFQLQPRTTVGLLTGRPESLRSVTLHSLNCIGDAHQVVFEDELLIMNARGWNQDVEGAKVAGLRRFREMGYHVFAVIDNEPRMLEALAPEAENERTLLLQAETVFESQSSSMPASVVKGRDYALADLVAGDTDLPTQVQLVWHGVNDPANLLQFIKSGVAWAEIDVRRDPSGELICRHDSLVTTPALADEEWLIYDEAMAELESSGAGIKLDIKGGVDVLDRILASVRSLDLPDHRLWFNGELEQIGEGGFRKIRATHPAAIVQCPIGWLNPLLEAAPDEARRILGLLVEWGVSRFSVNWEHTNARALHRKLAGWGYEVNFYGIRDLEGFLEAVVMLPCSVTSDFNFPQWNYFGRGSGHNGERFVYTNETTATHG
ncbi:MAG: hypothetical protein BMS9Abin17_1427 [Acidimicrobiia bacterium]|nr:MAG: hypothetical protein BMS9Abin17_1427 [Acidimicrobiia bacterium]